MSPSRPRFRFGLHAVPVGAACLVLGRAAERPNILWITVEDMSPTLACYGDPSAGPIRGRANARHRRCASRPPGKYPVERVLAAAELVGDTKAAAKQRGLLKDSDAGVRY